jgi:hypothetical protein
MGDELDILEVDDESDYFRESESHRGRANSHTSSDVSRRSSDGSVSDELSGSNEEDGSDGTDDDDLFASTLGSDFLDLFARDGLIGGDESDSDEDALSPSIRAGGETKMGNDGGSARHSSLRFGGSMSHGENVDGRQGGDFVLGSARGSSSLTGALTPRPVSVGPPLGGVGLGSLAPGSGRRATTAMVFD